MRRDAEYLSVFSPNAGKYGPEKIWQTFSHSEPWNSSMLELAH